MPHSPAPLSLPEFTAALEQCLGQTFGEPVELEPVDEAVPLPHVLREAYRFSSARIKGRDCLLMAAKGRAPAAVDLSVHVSLVQAASKTLVIFAAPSLAAKEALALITAGVSFAVPGHVPHIPELGSDLRTYGDATIPRDTDDLSVKDENWMMPYLPRTGM